MAGETGADKYSNLAVVSVVESAANTLTFKKLETGMSLLDKAAWVVNRLEYLISPAYASNWSANGSRLDFGLALGNGFAAPAFDEVAIVDYNSRLLSWFTSVGFHLDNFPILKDFSALPGGGLLLPPNPLYIFAKGLTLTAAGTVTVRIWYQVVKLSASDYWELVEARRSLQS
jgi:hypothetical protein